MTIDADDEIFQDFLIEAGEILERLNEELVELEQRPDDIDVLNAVFRGFHTVKGGASFLGLDGLVGLCHRAEDVFNVLRNGQRGVDSALMDTALQVLDVANAMFAEVQQGQIPAPADPTLLEALEQLAVRGGAAAAERALDVPAQAAPTAGDISEEEFQALLDILHGKDQAASAGAADANAVAAPQAAMRSNNAEARQPAAVEPAEAAQPDATLTPSASEAAVRVDTRRLDAILNMVGELVPARNRLATLTETMADEDMSKAIANLDVVTANLQNAVLKTRMQPIKKVFGRFPRLVRDLARSLNKEFNLELRGEETDLDKNLVEALADPLVHLVRNAVDHGIESPHDRVAAGKPRAGTVILAAEQEGDHILLSIEDDGAGMDPNRLRRKAVEKGLIDQDSGARLDDKECYNPIFAAGFSTREQISDVSGRGVGMDVVNTRIGQEEVVIKPLGAFLQGLAGFAGATITRDGRIALILDVPSLMKAHAYHE